MVIKLIFMILMVDRFYFSKKPSVSSNEKVNRNPIKLYIL